VNVRNGLKIGTESSGDVRNVVFRNCTLTGRAELWRPLYPDVTPMPSAGVSLQSVDGGTLEKVVVMGITMANVRAPLFVRLAERGWGQTVRSAGALRQITIANLVATGAEWTSAIMGVPGRDVADIALSDIRITGRGGGDDDLITRPVPQRERKYPDAAHFRNLPAYGLYCRHVRGLRVDRTTLTVAEPDARPALVLDDVRHSAVRNLVASAPSDSGPVAWLRSARDCILDGIRARESTARVRLSGADTARVQVAAPAVVLRDPGVRG
jgi:hypothetical protein